MVLKSGLVVIATLTTFAATVSAFLLIWAKPIALNPLVPGAIWTSLIGPSVAIIATIYLAAKHFLPAMMPPYSFSETESLPYGIQDVFSIIASCIGAQPTLSAKV